MCQTWEWEVYPTGYMFWTSDLTATGPPSQWLYPLTLGISQNRKYLYHESVEEG